ncbi:MAG: hypothetical protein LBQ84_04925 [Flavobacteriaceae bacterium]|jgi:hypothetical protein|nr:hypothetical protein [Flavobacteriaceae bacterium]
MNKIIFSILVFTNVLAYSQVGIYTDSPTETLDVNGNIRIRKLVDIDTLQNPYEYTHVLKVNSDGVLGTMEERKMASNNYDFYGVYSAIMSEPVVNSSLAKNGEYIDLGVSLKVEIPPRSAAIFFIDYNIPINFLAIQSSYIGYLGITLFKSGSVEGKLEEIQEGSRKFSASTPSPRADVSGMPVLGKAVEKIDNNTDSRIYVDYYLYGYIEVNDNEAPIKFGMYSATGNNYNWGKGTMTIMSYIQRL